MNHLGVNGQTDRQAWSSHKALLFGEIAVAKRAYSFVMSVRPFLRM